MSGAEFDSTRLVAALVAHDRWSLALSDSKSKRLPYNAGVDVTARLVDAVDAAAGELGVSSVTLVALIQAERRTDPGPDIAGAIQRVIEGLTLSVTGCPACGCQMPNYAIYRDFHAEHCPEIGPQRAEPIDLRVVETVEAAFDRERDPALEWEQ